jgi:hypothetical protein
MKAYRLSELRDLVQSAEFAAWWTEFLRAGAELEEKAKRAEELHAQAGVMDLRAELAQRGAADTLSRAGDLESQAAELEAEAQGIENRSQELVAQFEELRFKVSDLWYRVGAAERTLEERREALASAGEAAPAARPTAKSKRRPSHAETLLKQAERAYITLREEYERESQKKERLWAEVEKLWARTVEIALVVKEQSADARRVRHASERLFQQSEERRARAKQLRQESDQAARQDEAARSRCRELLTEARQRLGCVSGERFLYWMCKEHDRSAYALALYDEPEAYNLEVKALGIYAVSRQRGVGFLEPVRDGHVATPEEGDRRFDEYLLGPRKGRTPGAEVAHQTAS